MLHFPGATQQDEPRLTFWQRHAVEAWISLALCCVVMLILLCMVLFMAGVDALVR